MLFSAVRMNFSGFCLAIFWLRWAFRSLSHAAVFGWGFRSAVASALSYAHDANL
jgi:hypothetical protein